MKRLCHGVQSGNGYIFLLSKYLFIIKVLTASSSRPHSHVAGNYSRMWEGILKSFIGAVALCLAMATAAQAEIRYSISGIETADGYADRIFDINASGAVTGSFKSAGGTEMFLSDGSGVTRFGNGGTGIGWGTSINDQGMVGGTLGSGANMRPLIFDGSTLVDLSDALPQLRGTAVFDLNNSGQSAIGGYYFEVGPSGPQLVFKNFGYDGSSLTDFRMIGTSSAMTTVSEDGLYGGQSVFFTSPIGPRPTYYDGALHDLPTFGGGYISAIVDFNDANWATGMTSTPKGPNAFFFDGTTVFNLGTLLSDPSTYVYSGFGASSNGRSINNMGTIVGESVYDGGASAFHAFLYEGGGMQDLNSLIDPASGWTLTSAFSINDGGQIVGYGTYNGQTRGFILNPLAAVPEPASWAMMIAGFAVVGAGLRRKAVLSVRYAIA